MSLTRKTINFTVADSDYSGCCNESLSFISACRYRIFNLSAYIVYWTIKTDTSDVQ